MTDSDGSCEGPTRRRFLLRSLTTGALFAAAPAALAACVSSYADTGHAGTPRHGGSLTFARTADSQTVDPAEAGDNESIWVVSQLFERLYQSSATGEDTSVPCLATGYTVSSDRLTWTFALRRGVRFSDGTPMTSADVKFSLDRCTNSDANGYINVAIRSVETPDPYTVVVQTHYPTGLLGVMSYYANGILPDRLGGKSAREFFAQPVGTGAFHMTRWDVGASMLVKRNEYYWRAGLPYLDEVTFVVVSDDNSRILQLRGRQVDVIESPPWSQLSALKQSQQVEVFTFTSTVIDFLNMNTRVAPLTDPDVRQAIASAIDLDAIVRVALFGHGRAAGSIFPPTWPDHDPSLQPRQQDLRAAQQALARSRYPHGFTVTYSVDGGDAVQSATAQLIQSSLARIGITMKIQQYDTNTLATLVAKGQYDIYQDVLSLDIMDPFEDVPSLVDPSAGGDALWADYQDPKMIALSRQATRTPDPGAQAAIYREIQRQVYEDSPFIALYYVPYAYATTPAVQRLVVPPTGDYRLEYAWLTD